MQPRHTSRTHPASQAAGERRRAQSAGRKPQPSASAISQTALKVGSARAGEADSGPFWVHDENEDLERVDLDPAAAVPDRSDIIDMTVD